MESPGKRVKNVMKYLFYVLILEAISSSLSVEAATDLLQKSTSRCENICSHQNDTQKDLLGDCQRGCQYFNIEFLVYATDISKVVNVGTIEDKCKASCTEAYVQTKRKDSCFNGCTRMRIIQEQAPYINGWIIYMGASGDKGMVLVRPDMDISSANDWIILDSFLKADDYDYMEMKSTSNILTLNTSFMNDYLLPFWKWILPVLLLPLVLLTACNVMLGIRNIYKSALIMKNDKLNFEIIVEKLNNKQEADLILSNEKVLNTPPVLLASEYMYVGDNYPVKEKEKDLSLET